MTDHRPPDHKVPGAHTHTPPLILMARPVLIHALTRHAISVLALAESLSDGYAAPSAEEVLLAVTEGIPSEAKQPESGEWHDLLAMFGSLQQFERFFDAVSERYGAFRINQMAWRHEPPDLESNYLAFIDSMIAQWRASDRQQNCVDLLRALLASEFLPESTKAVLADLDIPGLKLTTPEGLVADRQSPVHHLLTKVKTESSVRGQANDALSFMPEGSTPPRGIVVDRESAAGLVDRADLIDAIHGALDGGALVVVVSPSFDRARHLGMAAAAALGQPFIDVTAGASDTPGTAPGSLLDDVVTWGLPRRFLTVIGSHGRSNPFPSRGPAIVVMSSAQRRRWQHTERVSSDVRIIRAETFRSRDIAPAIQAWLARHSGVVAEPSLVADAIDLARGARARSSASEIAAEALALLREAAARDPSGVVRLTTLQQRAEARTGLPLALISEDEQRRLRQLEQSLPRRIVGQRDAIEAVLRAIRHRASDVEPATRPAGAFLLYGPSGVGKTELARALAIEEFGSLDALARFDMGEYQLPHEVALLLGSPPGYIGHEESGALITALQRRHNGVLLFDEIEKAAPSIHNFLLGLLDRGEVMTNKGEVVSVRDWLVICTSNVGSRADEQVGRRAGFGAAMSADSDRDMAIKNSRQQAIREAFSPEFRNRFDAIIPFHALSRDDLDTLFEMRVSAYAARLSSALGMTLQVSQAVRTWIVDSALASNFGGREINRLFDQIKDRLADEVLLRPDRRGPAVVLVESEGAGQLSVSWTPVMAPAQRRRRAA